MDRLLRKLLEVQSKMKTRSEITEDVRPLTSQKSNAIRYMAGYVAITLMKRYKKSTKHAELKIKHQFFVQVLKGMQASDLPGDVDTLSDYTRLWSELIDRGGLYHINDKVTRVSERERERERERGGGEGGTERKVEGRRGERKRKNLYVHNYSLPVLQFSGVWLH